MTTVERPTHTQILVIGGGPAGTYAATALAREGHSVVLFEGAKFPRYHVGESMLPSMRNYVRFIGAEKEFTDYGFVHKPGASFKLKKDLRPTWTDFGAMGPGYSSWNVIRSEMDEFFFKHAEKEGVQTFDSTMVDAIEWDGPDYNTARPLAATWSDRKAGQSGKITFDWLVDASGRNGVVQMKYLKNRIYRESLRNVAVWGYWKGVKRHGEGGKKAGSGWFEALTDETGWAWYIPLHNGTTSIGIVMHITASNKKKATPKADGEKPTLTEHYLDQLQFAPGLKQFFTEHTEFIPGSTHSAADYSYFAPKYSGNHFRLIGDAANFVDPFFSSGVHIAMTGGLCAATTICASMNGDAPEEICQKWHDAKVGVAHTRFLFVVLSAYQQMHLQSVPTLKEVDTDNFDDAFRMFRPVIFGMSDSKKSLTDERVQQMMDNVSGYFDPTIDDENVKSVRARYGPELLNLHQPALGDEKIAAAVKEDDEEGRRVLKKMDAVKVLAGDVEATKLGDVAAVGYYALIERGKLGLKKAEDGALPQEEDPLAASLAAKTPMI